MGCGLRRVPLRRLAPTPATPYSKTEGALAAIRYARETDTPFLGTCGGFQHAVLEFVRNVLGEGEAKHAELDPAASSLAITPLTCELVEGVQGTRFGQLYGTNGEREEYHCRYGINPAYLPQLEARGLRCGARDDRGEVRALEHITHAFFVGTLFQPERRVLRTGVGAVGTTAAGAVETGEVHPLVLQFIDAASNRRMRRVRGTP